jgi:hypothetical protein
MWIWMCPNHIKAIWKTFVAETSLFHWLGSCEITFQVTSKEVKDNGDIVEALWYSSPFLLYLFALLGSCIYFIIEAVRGKVYDMVPRHDIDCYCLGSIYQLVHLAPRIRPHSAYRD